MNKILNKIKEIMVSDFDYPKNLKIEMIENNQAKLTFKRDGKIQTEIIENIIEKIAESNNSQNSEQQPE